MTLREAAVVAGAVSTVLFLGAYLPMLAKAWRTRDLHSYSGGSLTVTTLGHLVYTAYVVSLPVGPIWALHAFYLVGTACMLWWWIRWGDRGGVAVPEQETSVT